MPLLDEKEIEFAEKIMKPALDRAFSRYIFVKEKMSAEEMVIERQEKISFLSLLGANLIQSNGITKEEFIKGVTSWIGIGIDEILIKFKEIK